LCHSTCPRFCGSFRRRLEAPETGKVFLHGLYSKAYVSRYVAYLVVERHSYIGLPLYLLCFSREATYVVAVVVASLLTRGIYLPYCRLGCRAWFEWSDSCSNPSDGLSREGLSDQIAIALCSSLSVASVPPPGLFKRDLVSILDDKVELNIGVIDLGTLGVWLDRSLWTVLLFSRVYYLHEQTVPNLQCCNRMDCVEATVPKTVHPGIQVDTASRLIITLVVKAWEVG
jgi:hypothetical protein